MEKQKHNKQFYIIIVLVLLCIVFAGLFGYEKYKSINQTSTQSKKEERYPIQERIDASIHETELKLSVNLDELYSTGELIHFYKAESDYLDAVHQNFLAKLKEDDLLKDEDDDYIGWMNKRKEWVEKQMKDSTGGQMDLLEEIGLTQAYTLRELSRLAKKYYGITLQYES